MYQLLESKVLDGVTFGDWQTKDLSAVRLVTLFQLYPSCIIYVYDVTNDQNGWIDMYQLPVLIRSSPQTLSQYLSLASGLPILTDDPYAEKGDAYVRFLFAQSYGLYVKGTNKAFADGEELLPDQRIDILLSKTGITDYTSIVNTGLFTVNGLFFRPWAIDGSGIALNDAGKAASKYNDNRVGLLDFSNVGEVTTLAITTDMIQGGGTFTPLARGFFINTEVSLSGKTVGLVLAGKLYLLDEIVEVVGETKIKVNSQFIDFMRTFYETYKALDYSALGLTPNANFPDQFVASEFTTDATIKNFFTHRQSFLVLIDAVNLIREEIALKDTTVPGIYLSTTDVTPDLPVQVGNGFISEYNVEHRDGFWVLSLPHYEQDNYFFSTVAREDIGILRGTSYGRIPTKASGARMLLIKQAATT